MYNSNDGYIGQAYKKCQAENRLPTLKDIKQIAYADYLTTGNGETYAEVHAQAYVEVIKDSYKEIIFRHFEKGSSLEFMSESLLLDIADVKAIIKAEIATFLNIPSCEIDELIKKLAE